MPQPYTTRFAVATAGNEWRSYLVPAGHRAVVTCINFSTSNSTAAYGAVRVAGVTIYRWDRSAPDSIAYSMRTVAFAGELIEVYTSALGLRVIACGYLFDDTSGELEHLQDSQVGLPPPGDDPAMDWGAIE